MSLRRITYGLLTTKPALTALVPLGQWYSRGGTLDTPPTPYVVLAWLGTLTTSGRAVPQLLDVYVHDRVGDYTRIDTVLGGPLLGGGIYEVLANTTHYAHPGVPGSLVQADYLGTSGDLTDPEGKTGFMFSSWKLLPGG